MLIRNYLLAYSIGLSALCLSANVLPASASRAVVVNSSSGSISRQHNDQNVPVQTSKGNFIVTSSGATAANQDSRISQGSSTVQGPNGGTASGSHYFQATRSAGGATAHSGSASNGSSSASYNGSAAFGPPGSQTLYYSGTVEKSDGTTKTVTINKQPDNIAVSVIQ
jgi:hypothetical protein